MADLEATIDDLWERRDSLEPGDQEAEEAVLAAVRLLDTGEARVAELDPTSDGVVVNQWLKRAILLLFRQSRMDTVELGPFEFADKIPLKGGYEAAASASCRRISAFGSFLEPGVILMPSYVNIGARVGSGTMVDTWRRSAPARRSGATCTSPAGSASAGCSSPRRRRPPSSVTRPTSGAAASSPRGRGWGGGGARRRRHPDATIPVIDAETARS
jgi:2,3,4,5-tetrahydropyridine-2-carboxylate N-succinyltransferase